MSTTVAPVDTQTAAQLDQLCVNTIRTLSIDAVQQAKSGHQFADVKPNAALPSDAKGTPFSISNKEKWGKIK